MQIDPKLAFPRMYLDQRTAITDNPFYKTKTVFVGGVSHNTSQNDLRTFFKSFGEVKKAILVPDKQLTGRHRGFGFVTFLCEESVEKVCSIGYHNIHSKRVSF